jgi:hypothetical protein
MKDIKLQTYTDKWTESGEVVSPYAVARAATPENMAEILDSYCNTGMKDYRDGLEVGEQLHSHHRTIQASVVRFCLGIIIGLSHQDYTDPRNEVPVAMGKKIEEMVKDGTLRMGYMI